MNAKSKLWKTVLVGGVPGIIMGTAGAAVASEVMNDEPVAENPEEAAEETAEVVETSQSTVDYEPVMAVEGEGLAVAHVDDDMSFGEAFAAARAEVGPGGLFVWHGNVYNTYTAEEWSAMDDDDRAEFAQMYQNTEVSYESDPMPQPEPEPQPEPVPGPSPVVDDDEQGLHIYGEEVYENEDGSVDTYIDAEVEGHSAVFVDVGSDETVDLAIVDLNDNAEIEDNEMLYVADSGMTVDDLYEMSSDSVNVNNDHDQEAVQVEVYDVTQYENEEGAIVTLADAEVEGHAAIIADLDGDIMLDTMAVDFNDNLTIEDDEIMDIADMGMTVGDLTGDAQSDMYLASNDLGDDYVNDADTSAFV